MEQPRDRYLSACCTLSFSLSVYVSIYPSLSLSLWRKSHFATTTSRFDQTLPVIHSSLHSHLSWSHFDTNENYNYLIYHSWKEKGLFQSLFLSSKKERLFILFYLFRRNVEYFAGEGLGRVLLATILDLLGSPYIRTALYSLYPYIRAIFIFKHDSYRHIRLPIRIKYFFVYNPFSRLQSSAASKLRLEGNAGSRLKEENFCFDDFKGG